MSDWSYVLHEELEKAQVQPDEFSRIIQRLLDHGTIWRGDKKIETELYDAALRVDTHLRSYFDVMGFRYYHDSVYQYIKVYPPGAQVPDRPGQEDTESFGFRKRLSAMEIGLALGLLFLYNEAFSSGAMNDDGEAVVTLEQIVSVMEMTIKMPLPKTQTERGNLLAEMRRLRLVRYADDSMNEGGDLPIFIRPMVTATVSEDVLAEVTRAATQPQNGGSDPLPMVKNHAN